MKKVLVLGGTGAMGVYTVPELSKMGYKVDVYSLDEKVSTDPNVTYTKANVMDDDLLAEILKKDYDAVVDFMLYKIPQVKKRLPMFLENTKHYIFFSTYRVYADKDAVTTESSPRFLDVSTDREYLDSVENEYSLYKAVEENIVRESEYKNWTIVRPAITFSKARFQLTTLEANILLYRALNGKTVVLPKDAMNVQATMSWAGDVGKMLSRLVLNEKAYGETYSVCTAEHRTWGEIAEYYKELIGLKYVLAETDDYLDCIAGTGEWRKVCWHQLRYDRMVNRVMDNSKILAITGMKQSELMPLKEGLKRELAGFSLDMITPNEDASKRMDEYLEKTGGI